MIFHHSHLGCLKVGERYPPESIAVHCIALLILIQMQWIPLSRLQQLGPVLFWQRSQFVSASGQNKIQVKVILT